MRHFGLPGNIPIAKYKDEWLTPPAIIEALGPFDLDPCAPIDRPWSTAEQHFTIQDDGLAQDWAPYGRTWVNPPYSTWPAWIERLACHGNGLALLFARTDTADFERTVWKMATAVMFLRGRLRFFHSNGVESKKNGGAPSCIVAYGAECAAVLDSCAVRGHVVHLRESTVVPIATQRRLRMQARRRA